MSSSSTLAAMQSAKRWLIHHNKIPHYANGSKRAGTLDSAIDQAQLESYEAAKAALFDRNAEWGLGFALGPDGSGGNWQGVDLDDVEANGLKDVFHELPGYVEYSISRNGAHAIGYGSQFETLGSNRTGIEAYSERRYFTFSASTARDAPLTDLAPYVTTRLLPLRAAPAAPTAPISTPVDSVPLGELRSALAAIPANCPYGEWQRIGAALKSVGGPGCELWLEWSYSSANVKPGEPEAKWGQLSADRTGYRAIFAEAQRRGWNNLGRYSSLPDADAATVAGLHTQFEAALHLGQQAGDKVEAWKRGITAAALMNKQFVETRYIVQGYIVEGVTLLVGAPKIGKSWMAYGLAIAVASGDKAFGSIATMQGDVLYLALEDNERRLKKRLQQMGLQSAPDRLTLSTEWPDLDNGCIAEIESWIKAVERPVMVIIDVLNKIKPRSKGSDNQYEADYRTLTGLQKLALQNAIAIVVLHHTRKQEASDPFDLVSGTRGLTGAADSIFVLTKDRSATHSTLYGRGRDIEEVEVAMQFSNETGDWSLLGNVYAVAKTSERQQILEVLNYSETPLTPTQIAHALGKERTNVSHLLARMLDERQVVKRDGGLYLSVHRSLIHRDGSERGDYSD